jgi:hypothetical protein
VNQIGAIHRQWQHTFPLSQVAYFVLKLRDEGSIAQKLLNSGFPEPGADRLMGDDLRSNLAGMTFNVTPGRGLELLLTEPIWQSLTTGDSDALRTLASRYGSDFWAVLDHVATSRLQGVRAPLITNAASALHNSQLLAKDNRPENKFIIASIRAEAGLDSEFLPMDGAMLSGVVALLKLVKCSTFSRDIMQALSSSLEKISAAPKLTSLRPNELSTSVLAVLRAAIELGHYDQIPKPIVLPLPGAEWNVACQDLAKTPSIFELSKAHSAEGRLSRDISCP